ncbi:MAG TPA: 6-phosphofructokinase [Chloroflexia bacterium]|nr:6-phosphofructokinase [Chloroflexia bacterium]
MMGQLRRPVRRLGILTGGGDVPGLNAAIKAVVYRAEPANIEIIGIRAGWEGLAFLNRDLTFEQQTFNSEDRDTWERGYLRPLNRLRTRNIDRSGGTVLQSTRTSPLRVHVSILPPHLEQYALGLEPHDCVDLTDEVIQNVEWLGLDGVIAIGGDGTLRYASYLASKGVPVWAIPKTMDNDVPGTEYAIGFQTAINRAAESINRIRSTAGSHRETVVFRIFGRDAGFTALETAFVTWADRCIIPEVPVDLEHLSELVVLDRNNPSLYSIIVMSEGANLGRPVPELEPPDIYGHKKKMNIAEFLAQELTRRIPHVRFLPVDLTYELRSGEPDVYDKHLAIVYGNLIMSAVEQGTHGIMAAFREGRYVMTDIPTAQVESRRVDPHDYNVERYRPNFERIHGYYIPYLPIDAG